MDKFAVSGEIADWEDNKETVKYGKITLGRYTSIAVLISCLTQEGHAFDYGLANSIILCLPSFLTPNDFFLKLVDRYQSATVLADIICEQIQMKTLITLQCWVRNPCAHADLSGSLLEDILHFVRQIISSGSPGIVSTGKQIKLSIKTVKNDLLSISVAQDVYRNRAALMFKGYSNFIGSSSAFNAANNSHTRNRLDSFASTCSSTSLDYNFISTAIPPTVPSSNMRNSPDDYNALASDSTPLSMDSHAMPVKIDTYLHGTGDGSPSRSFRERDMSVSSMASVSLNEEFSTMNSMSSSGAGTSLANGGGSLPARDKNSYLANKTPVSSLNAVTLNIALPEDESQPSTGTPSIEDSPLPMAAPLSPPPISASSSVGFSTPRRGLGLSREKEQVSICDMLKTSDGRDIHIARTLRYDKLAYMLTIIEYEDSMLSIRPREFVKQTWTKKPLKTVHPDLGGASILCRYIHHTNQRIAWIAREIINHGKNIGPTHQCIEYFLRVARTCLRINNFNTIFQIVAALGLPAVLNLKAAWSNLATDKRVLFQSLLELCSSDNNYANYRKAFAATADQPRIPSIQILVKDVSQLEISGEWARGGFVDLKKLNGLSSLIYSHLQVQEGGKLAYTVRIASKPIRESASNTSKESMGNGSSETDLQAEQSHTRQSSSQDPLERQRHFRSTSSPLALQRKVPTTSKESLDHNNTPQRNTTTLAHAFVSPLPENDYASTLSTASRPIVPSPSQETISDAESVKEVRTRRTSSSASIASIASSVNLVAAAALIPSFVRNCLISRDSFFEPLHEHYSRRNIYGPYNSVDEAMNPFGPNVLTGEADVSSKDSRKTIGKEAKVTTSAAAPLTSPVRTLEERESVTRGRSSSAASQNSPYGGMSSLVSVAAGHSTATKSSSFTGFGFFFPSKSQINAQNKKDWRLCADDLELSLLQLHIQSIHADLNQLWEDSKETNEIESKRLMMRLTKAGLF